MAKSELSCHVVEQFVLRNKHQLFIQVFKGLDFMMHLNKNRLRRHFPIHAKGSIQILSIIFPLHVEFA